MLGPTFNFIAGKRAQIIVSMHYNSWGTKISCYKHLMAICYLNCLICDRHSVFLQLYHHSDTEKTLKGFKLAPGPASAKTLKNLTEFKENTWSGFWPSDSWFVLRYRSLISFHTKKLPSISISLSYTVMLYVCTWIFFKPLITKCLWLFQQKGCLYIIKSRAMWAIPTNIFVDGETLCRIPRVPHHSLVRQN